MNSRTGTYMGWPAVAAAATAFVMSASACAETIYRTVGPSGAITYSTQPVPDARESTTIEIDTLSPEQRRAAILLREHERALSAEVDARVRALENDWRRVDREIVSAQRALMNAENALQKGRTARLGERLGNVGGGTRLTQAYFQRLRELETRVEQAKQRLDKAYEARNALK